MAQFSQANIDFVIQASPSNWMHYANELKTSLDILWKENNSALILNYKSSSNLISKKKSISRPWLLLASFVIENLFKGLLIEENPEYISNGRLSRRVTHHRLNEIAGEISDLELSESEIELVSVLQTCLPYWGRYPIPLTTEEIKEETFASTNLHSKFEQLYYKLDLLLYDRIKNGWAGPHSFNSLGCLRTEYEELPENHEQMTIEELIDYRNSKSH